MIYKSFKDKKLSALGMGCMRYPVIEGSDAKINEQAATEMIDFAMKNGINYYDTAWGYHFGNSEIFTGKALSRYPRDSYYLATKFPGYDLSSFGRTGEIFEKQLEKCGVEHFDFYLLHNICEMNIEHYLDDSYGTLEYFLEQKKNGRITHLGFSTHGNLDIMKRFLEKYGEYMEFCQIQLNWLDWDFQYAKGKVELLEGYNIPVWVMEPLRGGSLAKLDEQNEQKLKQLRQDENAVGWAFRFIQSIPSVTVTLSGMSNMEQLKQNIEIFSEEKPLDENEMAAISDIVKGMLQKKTVPCTACRYCVSYCPQELEIPSLLSLYNEHSFSGGGFIAPMALSAMEQDKRPSACIGCKSCEAVCPQQIKISEVMNDFSEMLNG